jgi:PAS domain S-box-containing protein
MENTELDIALKRIAELETRLAESNALSQKADLNDSNSKYFELFELGLESIFLIRNEDGKLLEANSAATIMYGYSKDELLQMCNTDLSSEVEETQKVTTTTPTGTVIIPLRYHKKKDGTVFPVEITGRFFQWQGKDVHVAAIRDISQRLECDNALIESERRYRFIAENSNDVIWTMDLEGRFTYVSPSVFQLRGYTPEEVLSQSLEQAICPDSLMKVKAAFEYIFSALASGSKLNTEYFEIEQPCKDGSTVWTEATARVMFDNGKPIGLVGITRDISQRKRINDETQHLLAKLGESHIELESAIYQKNSLIDELAASKEELLRTNAEKDKFFSIIAHDLKSPFSGFLGLTKVMASQIQDLTMHEMQELSNEMQNSASNLYKLLENLLEWSRIQRGAISFNPEIVYVKGIVDMTVDFIQNWAEQKEISITNTIDETWKSIIDINMISTVIRNLISNAIKFTPRGGRINISAKVLDNKFIEVSVNDTGMGMDQETIAKLFKIDEKVSSLGTEGEPSTGLGLLLCKEFIDKNTGQIRVESKLGIGSSFIFTLPKA